MLETRSEDIVGLFYTKRQRKEKMELRYGEWKWETESGKKQVLETHTPQCWLEIAKEAVDQYDTEEDI